MTNPPGFNDWPTTIARLSTEWAALGFAENDVEQWEPLMVSMKAEVDDLRRNSRWRSGPRTLWQRLGCITVSSSSQPAWVGSSTRMATTGSGRSSWTSSSMCSTYQHDSRAQ